MSIDLSLDRIRRLAAKIPPYTRPTCHITGTNGKGSVTSLLSSIFSSSSLRTGRYTSPHLVSIYDCIAINDEAIHPDNYFSARAEIEEADKIHGTNLSSFELLTLTALRIFEIAQVDVVVLEVGMGGRLDATNIIPDDCVIVSAMTAVDLDHQAFLGNTISAITREKAGIARPSRPFVLGAQTHPEVEGVVKAAVKEQHGIFIKSLTVEKRESKENANGTQPSNFSLFSLAFNKPPPQQVRSAVPCFPGTELHTLLPLYGDHQLDNLGTALSVISAIHTYSHLSPELKSRITLRSIAQGIEKTRWPGRLSFHTLNLPSTPRPLVVLADGAHNPASAATLATYITQLLSQSLSTQRHSRIVNLVYILALSQSPPKTPLQTLSALLPPSLNPSSSAKAIKTRVALLQFSSPAGMPWVKSVPSAELKDVVHGLIPEAEIITDSGHESAEDSLTDALKWAAGNVDQNEETLIVLAGSLYLVADFYRLLEKYGEAKPLQESE